jgi:phage terminase Nu1 subunit (DNA packaging protein)
MSAPGVSTVGHDAASALLQISPDQLHRLVASGVVRRAAPGKYIPAQLIRDYIAWLHAEPERRDKSPTQAEIAEHLDMSDRNLRDVLQALDLDHKQVSLSALRIAYIRRLRDQAAGRLGNEAGGLDLVQERAALARSQREAQDLKNAVARGEFAPVGLLADVLGRASSSVVDRFDLLEGDLRKACPDIPDDVLLTVLGVNAKARNEWLRATSRLVDEYIDQLVAEDEEADALDAADTLSAFAPDDTGDIWTGAAA